MTDDHVKRLLSHVGDNLETLELVNCFRAHAQAEYDPGDTCGRDVLDLEVREPLTFVSLNAVAKYCHRLQFFCLLDNQYTRPNEAWNLDEARDCDVSLELVKEANSDLTCVFPSSYVDIYGAFTMIFGVTKGTIYENPWQF